MVSPIKISYHSIEYRIAYVLDKLKTQRQANPNYKVIDIGGTINSWSTPVVDTIVDINPGPKTIVVDICIQDSWDKVFALVEQYGKFDYAITTHTLEDVYDPFITLNILPKIAKQGIITVPSIRTELSNVESSFWLGYIHHRWLFSSEDNKILVAPKLGMLEALARTKMVYEKDVEEIWYEWENDIPYKIFMDNYLGPDSKTVVKNYSKLIDI